ncbi:serine/threonine protein kinase [Streptomyces sp. DSM 40971]|nr:serine/threonine protein kinase [Streptomyces sp. DSM 40971]
MGSEAAYQSVPSCIGPYTVIARLDADVPGVPLPEQRFIARSQDGARTVLVCVPLPGADPGRFLAEAEGSRYLLGQWVSPATEVSAPGELPWHARPFLPALPLPTALALYGGPLPEHTVRAIGACLAETLAIAHGQGSSHAGISPGAVLLAHDGPRLGCFGAVRAAAPDGEPRSGLPGLESGSLPPEQASGGRPQPLGDIYALGATLAYAATGHTVPERQELPASVRGIVTGCLARDPAARPRAGELIRAFTEPAGPSAASRTAPVAEVDSTPGNGAGVTPAPGWLPARLTAAVARQSAEVLAAEIAATQTAPPVPTSTPPQVVHDVPAYPGQAPGRPPGAETGGPQLPGAAEGSASGGSASAPPVPPVPPAPPPSPSPNSVHPSHSPVPHLPK